MTHCASRKAVVSRIRSAIRAGSSVSAQTRNQLGQFSRAVNFVPLALNDDTIAVNVGRSVRTTKLGLNRLVLTSLRRV